MWCTDIDEREGDRRNKDGLDQVSEDEDELSYEFEPNEELQDRHNAFDGDEEEEEEEDSAKGNGKVYCWSWFVLCFDLSHSFWFPQI